MAKPIVHFRSVPLWYALDVFEDRARDRMGSGWACKTLSVSLEYQAETGRPYPMAPRYFRERMDGGHVVNMLRLARDEGVAMVKLIAEPHVLDQRRD